MAIDKNASQTRVYLDHNGTTPVSSVVKEKLISWAEAWGNPSSIHLDGRAPKKLMRESRKSIAQYLNASPLEIIFTSGGSEANNLVIKSVWDDVKNSSRKKFIFSSVEHPSIIKSAEYLKEQGAEVVFIDVSREGFLDLEQFRKEIDESVALVSIMIANNETGNIFPIKELAQKVHEVGALFHSDMVQSLGKMDIDVKDLGVDYATFSGHKFYALKGCGVLFVKTGNKINSLIHGGGQERGRRAGTENVMAIASLGEMLTWAKDSRWSPTTVSQMRDRFEKCLLKSIDGVQITGVEAPRVGNTSSVTIDGIDGESLLMNLDIKGFSVSTGAACSAGSPEPSPVLLAMGLTRREAQSSLRVSFGLSNTGEDVEYFINVLKETVTKLRSFKPQGELSDARESGS